MTIDEIVKKSKIFSALRASSIKTAKKIIEALVEGGLKVIYKYSCFPDTCLYEDD